MDLHHQIEASSPSTDIDALREEDALGEQGKDNARLTSCLACRTIKAKCVTPARSTSCSRCSRRDEPCIRPPLHRGGRPKGSKNSQTRLERALLVIERESRPMKRKRSHSTDLHASGHSAETIPQAIDIHETCTREPLSSLSGRHQRTIPLTLQDAPIPDPHQGPTPSVNTPALFGLDPVATDLFVQPPTIAASRYDFPIPQYRTTGLSPHTASSQPEESTNNLDGGLSNPVRLLAEAAEEESSSGPLGQNGTLAVRGDCAGPLLPSAYSLPETLRALLHDGAIDPRISSLHLDEEFLAQGIESLLSEGARQALSSEDKRFFKPPRKEVKRDLGPELDPLSQALLNQREVNAFFESFFLRLHPMLPVLDPILHTPEFVQSRSAFLFTAICAHGASLTPGAEEATKRLRLHAQRLSDLISRRGFASVEEERLWHETKYAINMAVELELAKPLPADRRELAEDNSLAACLEGVQLDAWEAVERVARNRQRLWLHLFLLDSGLSLAVGKATRFTQDELIRDQSRCFHNLATRDDKTTMASVILRRRMVNLCDRLRSECDARRGHDSAWVTVMVDEVLDPWYQFWRQQCGRSAYLGLVYRHTRLWILSYALQALTTRSSPVEALSTDCFAAALSSCEYVCEQLRQSKSLWGFPNTMGPMLSFEALLAIRLFPISAENAIASKARMLGLLAQMSLLLEQVGATPAHRLGTAAVYGRHLQVFIRRRIITLCLQHHSNETSRFQDTMSGFVHLSSSNQISPMQQAEVSIGSLFATQPPMTEDSSAGLGWAGDSTLGFLDATAGWTDDFFRIFGGEP